MCGWGVWEVVSGECKCVHVLRVDRNNVVQDTLVQVGELVCVGGSVVCVGGE